MEVARELAYPDEDVWVDSVEVDPSVGVFKVWEVGESDDRLVYAEDAVGGDVTKEHPWRRGDEDQRS